MNSRTRVISQNKAVYVSQTGWYRAADEEADPAITEANLINPHQLHRVDTFSFDIDLAGARQDIREFGQLARIGTLTMSDIAPSISLGYYLVNGENEKALGFTSYTYNDEDVAADEALPEEDQEGIISDECQMLSGILAENTGVREKNIYVLTAKEGEDAFIGSDSKFATNESSHDVIGFGNCVITSYTANFSVGEIPRADVEMEASNIVFWTGVHTELKNPAINEEGGRADAGLFSLTTPNTGNMNNLVLRPDDIIVSFESNDISASSGAGTNKVGGTHFGDVCVQSLSIELPLSRGNIECLGKERAYAKPLEFPINITMNMSAIVKNFSAGALENVLTGTAGDNKASIRVLVKNDGDTILQQFDLKNAVLDSQNFSIGLDDNETVDLTFSAQIGGISTTTEGLFWRAATASYSHPVVSETLATATANQPI